MRHFVSLLLAALGIACAADSMLAGNTMNTTKTDSDGHVLTAQWAEFKKASDADRPQKMQSILSEIKAEALKKRLCLDFYDAGKEYIDVSVRRNWKLRDSLRKCFAEEVARFDEPIVTYTWMKEFGGTTTDERWEYVKAHRKDFSQANRPFYAHLGSGIGKENLKYIADDREYVLWDCFRQRQFNPETPDKDEVYAALKECVKGRYPNEQYLAYRVAMRLPETKRKAAMEKLTEDFKGTAMAFWPRQEVLGMDFKQLNRDKASSTEYRDLRDRCAAFEKDRRRLTGDEATIARMCGTPSQIIETLEAQDVWISARGDRFQVRLRNRPSVRITLQNEKKEKVFDKTLTNPTKSFYVQDTLEVMVPKLPDGTYTAEAVSGKYTDVCTYDRYRLSLALRSDGRGQSIYVTEHLSGRPLDKAEVVLMKKGSKVTGKTIPLDGFTPLPKEITDKLDDRGNHSLSVRYPDAEGLMRCSNTIYISKESGDRNPEPRTGTWCNLYRDRGAYNPGDTLQFKAVVFRGDLIEKVAAVPDCKITVIMENAEGKEVSRMQCKTNRFGSASGSFVLPKDQRNGYFSLSVTGPDGHLTSQSFRVDEFVLPTFELTFDKNETLYMPGDEVRVSGKVSAFSGHSLSGARIRTRVLRYGTVVDEQEIIPQPDGSFEVRFKAESAGNYVTEARVTDATGETLDFSTSLYVNNVINVSARILDQADGEFEIPDDKDFEWRKGSRYADKVLLTSDELKAEMTVTGSSGDRVPMEIHYALVGENGKEEASGTTASGETLRLDLSGLPSGYHILRVSAAAKDVDGDEVRDDEDYCILLVRPKDTVLNSDVQRMFLSGPSEIAPREKITLRTGTTDGDLWGVVTLFGRNREVLETRKFHLKGEKGEEGSLTDFSFEYKDAYPDAVRLQVFCFKNGRAIRFDREIRRKRDRLVLPLTFTSLTDKAFPGTEYAVRMKTATGAEALVSIYDRSIDAVQSNHWPVVTLSAFSVPYVSVRNVCGGITGEDGNEGFDDRIVLYDAVSGVATRSLNSTLRGRIFGYRASDEAVEEAVAMESAPVAAPMAMAKAGAATQKETDIEDVPVREKFENALAFLPHLTSDGKGDIEFTFRTSDKLSTYHVDVYAHDPDMRNAFLRQDVVVSIPVKVALNEPRYLYAGDNYNLTASVSSNSEADVKGRLILQVFPDGSAEPASTQFLPLTVPAGGVADGAFSVAIPSGPSSVTLKTVFLAADESFSDAVKVDVPVKATDQTLTEAHSAVLRDGMDREALLYELRKRFVNVDGAAAELNEISILDMIRDAIPDHVDPRGNDVLSLSEAWYSRLVASTVSVPATGTMPTEEILEKILACRNADGGFAWFEGMNSSPVITAVVMERVAKLRGLGFEVPDLSGSAKYLDTVLFDRTLPLWCGWLSDEQYRYVRSLYPNVPFDVSPSTKTGRERLSDFKKETKEYLVPTKARGLSGQILPKARRIMTLRNLLASDAGEALAKAWGVKFGTVSKMRQSAEADVLSLLEYAVEHRDGGWYYPNAVMPFRGLLESEAYAHALLCDLLTAIRKDGAADPRLDEVANGIRLWLMLQKETQQWGDGPAYVDALTSVLNGPDSVLATKVLALSATYTKPFSQLKAAGNGFKIDRKFFRAVTVEEKYNNRTEDKNRNVTEYKEIRPGDPVRVGEKIFVRYEIWNQENRSFVRLTAPREAAFTPVNQLSGHYGWWMKPLRISSFYTFTPQGYRNVKADRTEYFFDSYPEEKTTVTEEFFVTRSGSFSAPVVEIESLYAPHYRANGAFEGVLPAEP